MIGCEVPAARPSLATSYRKTKAMSSHPDHSIGYTPSSFSSRPWEAWAVACIRRLEVLASVANHFAFEAQTESRSVRSRKIGSMLEAIRAAAAEASDGA